MKKLAGMLLAAVLIAPTVWADTYTIDPAHSSVSFRVKHLVGKVSGKFAQYTGTFSYDPAKPQATTAEATIQTASIDTGITKRDNHLRSPDFFNAPKFPTITFKSTGVTDVQGTQAKLQGTLTMHGVTKPVVLALDVSGIAKDPMGGQRAGASATTKINRNDFAVGPSTGPMSGMVGSDVEITIDIEGTKK
jgi:polyisoprenoid-binding protein YceI